MTRLVRAAPVAVMLLLMLACAKQAPPPGGPEDRVAPKVVSTDPPTGTVHVDVRQSIRVVFSKPMNREDVEGAVNIFPAPPAPPDFDWHGETLELKPDTVWAENQTYVITLQAEATDRRHNRLAASYQFAFGTGDRIDSGSILGQILRGERPAEGALALCYRLDGTSTADPELDTADYVVQTDGEGFFRFEFLSPGRYRVFGLDDRDRDWLWNIGAEDIAVPTGDLVIDSLVRFTAAPPVFLRPLDTVSTFLAACLRVSPRHVRLTLDGAVDSLVRAQSRVEARTGGATREARVIQVPDSLGTDFFALFDSLADGEACAIRCEFTVAQKTVDSCQAPPPSRPEDYPEPGSPRILPDTLAGSAELPAAIRATFDQPLAAVRAARIRAVTAAGDSLVAGLAGPFGLEVHRADYASLSGPVLIHLDPGAVQLASGANWPTADSVVWAVNLPDADSTGTFDLRWDPPRAAHDASIWLRLRDVANANRMAWFPLESGRATGRLVAGDYTMAVLADRNGDLRQLPGWPRPFAPSEAMWLLSDTLKVRARFSTELNLGSADKN